MRKLATVRRISDIQPIEGADAIELAIVDGWKVVVAKNVGHQVGNLVVYCEIDSFLPLEPEFEFLRKSSYKRIGDQEGFRLKTIKLRGQVSQGLIIPLRDAYAIYKRNTPNLVMGWFVGLDVSDMLNITKYEPPIPAELAGKVKGLFPSFIRKTDEERIQNLASKYDHLKRTHKYVVTEKLDGSSATFYIKDGGFGVCSRNLELLETEGNTFWKIAHEMNIKQELIDSGRNLCIQGELIGEGIQGNPYKIKGQTVKFFNAFDIDKQEYLGMKEFIDLMNKTLNLPMVPILDLDFILPETIEELIEYADDLSVLNESFNREGVVIRSWDRMVSFKVISNKFLLKEK
jgi:RNA ligase (TIGR02306 family)